jgi:GGDEF domain-containing protein
VKVDNGLTLQVMASVGRVLAGEDDAWEDLIERADLDMYRVKHLSRDGGRIPTQR